MMRSSTVDTPRKKSTASVKTSQTKAATSPKGKGSKKKTDKPVKTKPVKQAKAKPEKLSFVQDLLPIKDVKNGVIQTTDGRYIKILEIMPINFQLFSDKEQFAVIQEFASWLKIAPIKIQIKTLTRRTNATGHIRQVQEEVAKENDLNIKAYAEDYISLVKSIGSRESVTRRFFLIFEYEASGYAKIVNDEFEVYQSMYQTEMLVRSKMADCGNVVLGEGLSLDDATTEQLEFLYVLLNRKSSFDESFESRFLRVANDAILSTDNGKYPDNVPWINYIAPRGANFRNADYYIMDGMYYTTLYITADGYPSRVGGSWLTYLINYGNGVDVDIHLKREDKAQTIDRIARKMAQNQAKLNTTKQSSTDFEEIRDAVTAAQLIREEMSTYNMDIYYLSVFITLSAEDLPSLYRLRDDYVLRLKARDMKACDCKYRQEAGFLSTLPLNYIDPGLCARSRRNVTTYTAAATYPFTAFEMTDDTGVLFGVNRQNNSMCVVDLFNTRKNKNANAFIIGTSGAGKSYTLKVMSLRMRMRGLKTFVILPEKGKEFNRAANYIGGEIIKVAPGSQQAINIMEIRDTTSPDEALLDGGDFEDTEYSMLSRKIQQLTIFFSLLDEGISNEEYQLLDEALFNVYADFGITKDNDSIFVNPDEEPSRRVVKPMPILGDLQKKLNEDERSARLATLLTRFVTGSAQNFNQRTNVNLNNKYIIFDLSQATAALLPICMFIVLDYVWDEIKKDRTTRSVLIMDEMWKMIGENKLAANYCLEIWKTIRGYAGSAIGATQEFQDFFKLDGGKYGRSIVNNSKNKILLNMEEDDISIVKDLLHLTQQEERYIARAKQGEGLLYSNGSKVAIAIRASQLENSLATTDHSELSAIVEAEKRKREGRKDPKNDPDTLNSIADFSL